MADDDDSISLCAWEFIWSFFIHCPEARSWLFRNYQPSMAHVVKSLLNGPLLNGFILTALESSQSHIIPDIGDLDTSFIHRNGTTLGFAFGYQRIMPIVPLLHDITKDSHFSDAIVITRRTAHQKIDFPNMTFHIRIDFAWMVSGALVVSSSVQALRHYTDSPTFLRPAIDDLEVRVFFPEETKLLVDLVKLFDELTPTSNAHCSQSIKSLPERLLNPVFSARIRAWDQTHTSDGNLLQIERSAFSQFISRTIPPSLAISPETSLSQLFGIAHAFASKNHFTAQTRTMDRQRPAILWDQLRTALPSRKRNGVYRSIFSVRDGNAASPEKKMMWRISNYIFLCRKDFSVYGRIQRLCTQLGIYYTNPNVDGVLQNTSVSSNLEEFGTTDHSCIESYDTHPALPSESNDTYDVMDTQPRVSSTEQQLISELKRTSAEGDVHSNSAPNHSQSSLDCPTSKATQCEDTPSVISLLKHNIPSDGGDAISETLTRMSKSVGDQHSDDKSCQLESSEDITSSPKEEKQEVEMLDATSSVPLRRLSINGNIDLCTLSFTQRKSRSPGIRELWQCVLCGIVIRGKKGNLKRHIAFRHNDIRQFECKAPDCARKFHNRVNLKRHIVAVHEGRPFRCPMCPRDFKIKENMDAHIEKTHVKCASLLACEFCGSCFGYRSSLNRHKRTVHRCEKVEPPPSMPKVEHSSCNQKDEASSSMPNSEPEPCSPTKVELPSYGQRGQVS